MIKKEITENGLIADLFTDDSTQPEKTIVMLGGSEGGKSWSRKKNLSKFWFDRDMHCRLSLISRRKDCQARWKTSPLSTLIKHFPGYQPSGE